MSRNGVVMDVTARWMMRPEDYAEAIRCAMRRTGSGPRDKISMCQHGAGTHQCSGLFSERAQSSWPLDEARSTPCNAAAIQASG